MMISYAAILLAGLTPLVCAGIAKAGAKGYDNHNPREWMAHQTGYRARANAAQANCFEALPFFMGAVVIAHQLGAYQGRVDLLAFIFVVLRVVYVMMYIADSAKARSLVWSLALAVNIAILFIGYR